MSKRREPGSLEIVTTAGGSILICGESTWIAQESRRLPSLRAKFRKQARLAAIQKELHGDR